MKKIKYFILALMISILGTQNCFAATASIRVNSSATSVIVGNTVKVTVKVSSSDLGAWEYCISYDANLLKLVSSTADANTCVKTGYVTSASQKSSTETFTFKALKSGSAKVSVKSYAVYSFSDENQMSASISSSTIKLMTQSELEATYSKNAYLKSLNIEGYELSPKFNKETFSYSVEVPNEIEEVKIIGEKDDSKSTISGLGTVTLTEGTNKFNIVVTAQKGNTLTYVVNIYRKELDPIHVTYDNKDYTIVRKQEDLIQYKTFEATTINYNDEEIPALKSDITDYTLIGLKDEEGNITMFIFDVEIIEEYKEIETSKINVFPRELPETEKFAKYKKKKIDFNGEEIEAYVLNDSKSLAVIYGQNIESGATNYYFYDIKENTIINYNQEIDKYYELQIKNYRYFSLGLIALVVILLFIIIVRTPKKSKKQINLKKIEQEQKKLTKDNKNKKK